MKRCPECRRDYYDDSLLYCLDDGNALLEGPASSDEAATAFLPAASVEDIPPKTLQQPVGTFENTRQGFGARQLVIAGLLVVGIGTAIFGGYEYFKTADRSFFRSLEALKVSRLTTSGNIADIAISPDGRYFAYVINEAGTKGIRLKQIATGGDAAILPAESSIIRNLSYSPDGNFVYFAKFVAAMGTLYRIPALGGQAKQIAQDVSSGAGISPDGKRVVYLRQTESTSTLLIANADGTGEKELNQIVGDDSFVENFVPAWSRDSAKVYTAAWLSGKFTLISVDVANGSRSPISTEIANADAIQTLPNGTLIVCGRKENKTTPEPRQLWLIEPLGSMTRITNDVSDYSLASVTANGDSILTVKWGGSADLWVGENVSPANFLKVTSGGELIEVSWEPSGSILFVSRANNNSSLWRMASDGKNSRQITFDHAADYKPIASIDGKMIVFGSNYGGSRQVWRANADGSDLTKLTDGANTNPIGISPDGRFVIVESYENARLSLWKTPIEGGSPVEIPLQLDSNPFGCTVSRTTGNIACITQNNQNGERKVVIFAIEGGSVKKSLNLPTTSRDTPQIRFTPDGKSIAFLDNREGGANIWAMPIESRREATPITNFKNEKVYYFEWSLDGKKLAVIRGNSIWDAVLIADENPNSR